MPAIIVAFGSVLRHVPLSGSQDGVEAAVDGWVVQVEQFSR